MKQELELTQSFYNQKPTKLAEEILGKALVVQKSPHPKLCLITETESYLGEKDQASHARFGKTKRSKIMWKRGGFLYIYLIYGIHHMLNLTANQKNHPGAVLIRGATPVLNLTNDLNGPGKLTKELKITREDNNIHINQHSSISIFDFNITPERISKSPRIGVNYAGTWVNKPLRFTTKLTSPQVNQAKRKFSTID